MSMSISEFDYLDLVWTWYETSDPAAAIVWSPTGGWNIETVGHTKDNGEPEFTIDGSLIVVRDGWICGGDRFADDPVCGFKYYSPRERDYCYTGIADDIACWLSSHTGEIRRRYHDARRASMH